jgi:hypothetical protein
VLQGKHSIWHSLADTRHPLRMQSLGRFLAGWLIRERRGLTGGIPQLCGARGGGDAAKLGIFLVLHMSSVWMLACESTWERNALITCIRRVRGGPAFPALLIRPPLRLLWR